MNCKTAQAIKGKVFYGHEPSREESTTTVCGVSYELLAVILLKYRAQ